MHFWLSHFIIYVINRSVIINRHVEFPVHLLSWRQWEMIYPTSSPLQGVYRVHYCKMVLNWVGGHAIIYCFHSLQIASCAEAAVNTGITIWPWKEDSLTGFACQVASELLDSLLFPAPLGSRKPWVMTRCVCFNMVAWIWGSVLGICRSEQVWYFNGITKGKYTSKPREKSSFGSASINSISRENLNTICFLTRSSKELTEQSDHWAKSPVNMGYQGPFFCWVNIWHPQPTKAANKTLLEFCLTNSIQLD